MNGIFARIIKNLLIAGLCLNALALLIVVASLAFGAFPVVMKQSPNMFQDFVKYYACGKIALSEDRAAAYDGAIQQKYLREIIQPETGGVFPDQYKFPVDYPPLVYPLMAPLAVLPLNAAVVVFSVLSILVASAGISINRSGGWKDGAIWMLLITSSPLSWRTLAMGQMTWLVLGFLALYLHYFLRGRDIPAGLALSMAALKVQYAAFFLIPVLIMKRWRALVAFLVPALALGAAAVAVMGIEFVQSYPEVVRRIEGADPYVASMTCIRGLSMTFIPAQMVQPCTTLGIVAGLVLVSFLWKTCKDNDEPRRWAAAATICTALIASPHTHSYDSLFLMVGAVVTIKSPDPFKLGQISSVAERVWTALLMLLPLASWALFKIPPGWLTVQVVTFVLLYTILLICAVKRFTETNKPKEWI